jgi:hypothetical protein
MLEQLEAKAKKYGATSLGLSTRKNKRLFVIYNGKAIHFGAKNGSTYVDHHDDIKRKAWKARHSKILLKDGTPAYKNKESPEFWSWHILW